MNAKKRAPTGRPPDAARPRAIIVATRAMRSEREGWNRAARAAGVPLGVWLRDVANRAASRGKRG